MFKRAGFAPGVQKVNLTKTEANEKKHDKKQQHGSKNGAAPGQKRKWTEEREDESEEEEDAEDEDEDEEQEHDDEDEDNEDDEEVQGGLNVDEEDDDEGEDKGEDSKYIGKLVIPETYASNDVLRARLRAKIEESEAKHKLSGKKKQAISNRRKEKKEKEAKDKKRKKQKLRHGEAPRRADSAAAAAGDVAGEAETKEAKKEKKVVEEEKPAIKTDFEFGSIALPLEVKKLEQGKRKEKTAVRLAKLENFQDRLNEMKASGEVDKVENIKHKKTVKNILSLARGERIEDERTLKKKIKIEEKKKEKSSKEWKKRTEIQDKDRAQRQARRNENIQKKVQNKIAKQKGTFKKEKKPKFSNKGDRK